MYDCDVYLLFKLYFEYIHTSHSTTLRYECIFMDQFIGTEIGVRLANNHVSSLPLDFGCSGFGSAANPYPLMQGSKPEPLKKNTLKQAFTATKSACIRFVNLAFVGRIYEWRMYEYYFFVSIFFHLIIIIVRMFTSLDTLFISFNASFIAVIISASLTIIGSSLFKFTVNGLNPSCRKASMQRSCQVWHWPIGLIIKCFLYKVNSRWLKCRIVWKKRENNRDP